MTLSHLTQIIFLIQGSVSGSEVDGETVKQLNLSEQVKTEMQR